MAIIEDVSPTPERTTVSMDNQSASGRGLTIAASPDGQRVYIGNNAGVWRSDDSGLNWKHMVRPQPKPLTTSVQGALLCLNVYDLAVASKPDIVLAATSRDIRQPAQSGIYRSTDGAVNWKLVQQLDITGQLVAAPDDPSILFAAAGSTLFKSIDSGATWSTLPVPLAGAQVWHVAVGKGPDATRHIYALGADTRIWFSTDGGANWKIDTGNVVPGSPPADAVGPSTRILSIHPANSKLVYVIGEDGGGNGNVARGDYSGGGTPAAWTSLPGLTRPANTTASGTRYVCAHVTQEGNLYLFASDQSGASISIGDNPANWRRMDGPDAANTTRQSLHIDPHAIWLTPDFRLAEDGGARGKIWQVNDGGVDLSTDGGVTWKKGQGFTAQSSVNVSVSAVKGQSPRISLHTGDNGAFFSSDGGRNWVTADYQQGDNDATFVDPRQPSLLYVFAPRGDDNGGFPAPHGGVFLANGQLIVYKATGSDPINAGVGTSQRTVIPGPTPHHHEDWSCVSSSTAIGYRPLILTLAGETPRPGGDFIAIRYKGGAQLVRTNALGSASPVSASADWFPTTTGLKVFLQGPPLPNQTISIVQASGGHTNPVFYVGDTAGLWKWTAGMPGWQALVPQAGGPQAAIRFYVDPYRPDRIYLIDKGHVWQSVDGGATWTTDDALKAALTENGAIPMSLTPSGNPTAGRTPLEALLQDFVYDSNDPKSMIAVGPAGVFTTSDAARWDTVALCSALNTRVMSTFLDTVTDPKTRVLYVATPYRGLLKMTLNDASFQVFRTFSNPFVASSNPANPDVTKPEGKLQKALTDAIIAKAGSAGHSQILKARDPQAADFLSVFPIPFSIADVSGPKPFPVAHYNGDEVDFIASEAQLAVLFAALELRLMVRRYITFLGIKKAPELRSALKQLAPSILKAVPLLKAKKDLVNKDVRLQDGQILPNYERVLHFDDSGASLQVNFNGAIAQETDTNKKKRNYDFGPALFDMIVNGDTESAANCIESLGLGYINGALEAGGFFERPTPSDPKTFRGIWVGGDYSVNTIRGELAINDVPAQFGGTTRTFARLLALIRAKEFADPADPNGDLMSTLLSGARAALQPGSKFTYDFNKQGWAPLGILDPNANWVASEAALIHTVKPDATIKNYIVAWQNLELIRDKDGNVTVPTKGGHLLYQQSDIVDIIANTIAAYQ